jgi:serine phosphatase RsbU (regulator of sigma subunit)
VFLFKKNIAVFILLLYPVFLKAQATVDSLENLLITAKIDTVKINLHIQLGDLFIDSDSTKAYKNFKQAIRLAHDGKNKDYILRTYKHVGRRYNKAIAFNKGLVFIKEGLRYAAKWKKDDWRRELYLSMADLYQYQNLSKQSLPWFDSASLYAKNASPANRADIIMYKGRAWYDIGEYKQAMELYVKAEKIFEENKLFDRNYGFLMHFIGSVFKRQKLYDKALVYYEKEMDLAKKLKDVHLEAEALYLCASMYGHLGNGQKDLECQLKALAIYKAENNEGSIALMLGNLSGYYYAKKDYTTAVTYLEQAREIFVRKGDQEKIAWVYGSLGDNYSQLGNASKSVECFKKALEANSKTETKQLLNMAGITKSMAFAFERAGKYKDAFETYLDYEVLRDSIVNQDNKNYLNEVEAKYETEKKEQQITLLNKDKEKQKAEIALKDSEANEQKAQRNLLLIGCVLVLAVAAVAGWAFLTKRKANKILAEQFEEINHKNIIIREKNKDITDSINYAKRIQEAVLPLPGDLNNFFSESFVFYRPKDIVSGDFYWFSQMDDFAILAVGDCTGHGVPGAFMSIIGHDLLNQVVLEDKVHKPAEILRYLDKRVTNTLNKRGSRQEYHDGMDIAICAFDKKERKVTFAGANRPLVIKRGEEIIELPPNKFAIGGSQDSSCKLFYQHELKLTHEDIVYMFSDGYHDQFGGASGKKLKYHQLKDYISKLAKQKLADHQGVFAMHFDAWRGDIEQVDDVCLIGVRI